MTWLRKNYFCKPSEKVPLLQITRMIRRKKKRTTRRRRRRRRALRGAAMKVELLGVSKALTSLLSLTSLPMTTIKTSVLSGGRDYREATDFVIVSSKERKRKTTKIKTDEKYHWFNYRDGNIEREMSLKAYQNAHNQVFSGKKGSDYSDSPKPNIKIVFI